MTLDKIEKVAKVKKALKPIAQPITEVQERAAPNKEQFSKLMNTEKTTTQNTEADKRPSLMDEIRNLNQKVDGFAKSPQQLVTQAEEVITQIETLKDKLATPNLELKKSTQTLLNSKLSHIDENLRVALSKAGLEYTEPTENLPKVNPIERFLGFLTHGQEQLKTLSNEVELMHLNKKEITPANMLRIQIKVGYIQNEIDFFTNVLNQALQDAKTIMNVQV